MSESNVDIVRRMIEASFGDQAEEAIGLLAPDVKWYGTVGGLEEGIVREGRDAVAAAVADSLGTWEDLTLEIEELIPVGDAVLLYWHEIARVQQSDAVVESRTAVVFTLADGLVTEMRGYMDRATARESLGLAAD